MAVKEAVPLFSFLQPFIWLCLGSLSEFGDLGFELLRSQMLPFFSLIKCSLERWFKYDLLKVAVSNFLPTSKSSCIFGYFTSLQNCRGIEWVTLIIDCILSSKFWIKKTQTKKPNKKQSSELEPSSGSSLT